jgi:predicted DCC family thiol-disulfide oxidoreductase YuxK
MIPIDMARDPTDSIRDRRTQQWIVLYDADCGFCRWSLARLLARDAAHRLRPMALGTPEADTLLPDLTPEQRAASWHLIAPDGRRASGGAAAAPLLRLLPRGRAPAAMLERIPRLAERGYRWVADHRSLLSKTVPQRSKDRAEEAIRRHPLSR